MVIMIEVSICRLPGEKMDVWVACFGWELNGGMYWGFSQGTRSETLEALATNATVRMLPPV